MPSASKSGPPCLETVASTPAPGRRALLGARTEGPNGGPTAWARGSAAAIAVCVGSSCRKRREHPELLDGLAAAGVPAGLLRCVGVCDGPVVIVSPSAGEPIVLRRVRSRKARRDLVRLARGRSLSGRLERHLIGQRKAAKAVRKARPAR